MTTTKTPKATEDVLALVQEWTDAVKQAVDDDSLRHDMIGVWMFMLGILPVLRQAHAKIEELAG